MDNTNSVAIIMGVDTHKSTHVALAINTQGVRLADLSIPANAKGYKELESWSRSLGNVEVFGIEGEPDHTELDYPGSHSSWDIRSSKLRAEIVNRTGSIYVHR